MRAGLSCNQYGLLQAFQSTLAGPNLLSITAGMSSSCATLAEVLWAKGSPLEEEDIWALLYLSTLQLLEDLHKG